MELRPFLILLLHGWHSAGAQNTTVRIAGIVTDSSGRAIQFANIKALPDGNRIVAGRDGRFAIDVDASVRAIEIRRIGFEPRVVNSAVWPDSGLTISLKALPLALERVRVEAEQQIQSLTLHGFYERQAELKSGINHGFMITPEEIEQRKGARVTDFMLGHTAIKVALVKPGIRGGRRGLQPQGLGGCRMEIYVDGIRFYTTAWPPDPRFERDLGDQYIDDQIPTSTIAAIEVYPRAVGAPPKYQNIKRRLRSHPHLDEVRESARHSIHRPVDTRDVDV